MIRVDVVEMGGKLRVGPCHLFPGQAWACGFDRKTWIGPALASSISDTPQRIVDRLVWGGLALSQLSACFSGRYPIAVEGSDARHAAAKL